jgi:predicted kinase
MCGLPGSGKTTTAVQIAGELGVVRLCPDEWMTQLGIDLFDEPMRARVESLQWQLARELLALDQSVVIEWGLWTRSERDAIRDQARALGVAVELHYLDVELETLWERVRARIAAEPEHAAAITHDDLVRWSALFEAPDDAEMALFDPSGSDP